MAAPNVKQLKNKIKQVKDLFHEITDILINEDEEASQNDQAVHKASILITPKMNGILL